MRGHGSESRVPDQDWTRLEYSSLLHLPCKQETSGLCVGFVCWPLAVMPSLFRCSKPRNPEILLHETQRTSSSSFSRKRWVVRDSGGGVHDSLQK